MKTNGAEMSGVQVLCVPLEMFVIKDEDGKWSVRYITIDEKTGAIFNLGGKFRKLTPLEKLAAAATTEEEKQVNLAKLKQQTEGYRKIDVVGSDFGVYVKYIKLGEGNAEKDQ